MKKIIFIFLLLILLVSGCAETTKERLLESALVTEVIDGDTIVIEDSTQIRLLNINTPEKSENCYDEAKERLETLVLNKQVYLERDKENTDQYNRKLRYVFLYENKNQDSHDGHVNLMLLKEGLAKLYIVGTNTKYQNVFRDEFNQINSGCLFNKGQYTECFNIINFHYDAQGSDCSNNNDEYIALENICSDINMNDWQIKDEARHVYTFKSFIAKQNQKFTFYTGQGTDTTTKIFWNQNCAIWNNDHDTFYMYDNLDNLILEYNY